MIRNLNAAVSLSSVGSWYYALWNFILHSKDKKRTHLQISRALSVWLHLPCQHTSQIPVILAAQTLNSVLLCPGRIPLLTCMYHALDIAVGKKPGWINYVLLFFPQGSQYYTVCCPMPKNISSHNWSIFFFFYNCLGKKLNLIPAYLTRLEKKSYHQYFVFFQSGFHMQLNALPKVKSNHAITILKLGNVSLLSLLWNLYP